MNKLLAALAAGFLAVASTQLLAAETKKDSGTPGAAASAPVKLEKPAHVTQDAWNKMSDTEKQKAVESAKADATKTATKKEKKGGC